MAVLLGSPIFIFYYIVLNLVLDGFSSNFVKKRLQNNLGKRKNNPLRFLIGIL